MKKNYNFEFDEESLKKMARGYTTSKPISVKYATEICREIKGKKVEKAETFLNNIVTQKEHLPLRKYNKKIAHKKGDAKSGVKTGRYPKKAAKVFLDLIQDVKANADYKGLDSEKIYVEHAFASIGLRRGKTQPKGQVGGKRRASKSTHLEIVLMEK